MILAATGHRPNKLGNYRDPTLDVRLFKLAYTYLATRMQQLDKTTIGGTRSSIPDLTVISGMALGWDQAWAEAAIELYIPVIAAVPFAGQESVWPPAQRDRYARLLKLCQRVEVITPGVYAPWKMQTRNKWMSDRCDELVALWDGSEGGTANCIRYHRSHHPMKLITNLWSQWKAQQ